MKKHTSTTRPSPAPRLSDVLGGESPTKLLIAGPSLRSSPRPAHQLSLSVHHCRHQRGHHPRTTHHPRRTIAPHRDGGDSLRTATGRESAHRITITTTNADSPRPPTSTTKAGRPACRPAPPRPTCPAYRSAPPTWTGSAIQSITTAGRACHTEDHHHQWRRLHPGTTTDHHIDRLITTQNGQSPYRPGISRPPPPLSRS